MSICALFIGKPETGKTTEAIKFIKTFGLSRVYAYDCRREYKYRTDKKIIPFHGSSDNWLKLLNVCDVRGCGYGFISDEAGDYTPHGSKYAPLTKPVRGKRFNANVYVFVYHSLTEVPDYVLRFTDLIVLKKSRGNPSTIAKKYEAYPEIIEAFNRVNSHKKQHFQAEVWI